MTIKIDNMEVNISAKGYLSDEYNEHDTLVMLNKIACWAYDSAELHKMKGYDALHRSCVEAGNNISDVCREKGLYGEV